MPGSYIKTITKALLPRQTREWIRARQRSMSRRLTPPARRLWQTEPISRQFGLHRGLPVDRYYIEKFLTAHRLDIRGHVLEIADANYTTKYGDDRVLRSDVLHYRAGNPGTTIVADLTKADDIPSDTFDCIILTQTLQFIYDFRAALRSVARILKPEGVLLATVPGIVQISRHDMERWGDYWRFTSLSIRRVFGEAFPEGSFEVTRFGNVLSAISLLHGVTADDLEPGQLDLDDEDYEVLLAIRAVRAGTGS